MAFTPNLTAKVMAMMISTILLLFTFLHDPSEGKICKFIFAKIVRHLSLVRQLSGGCQAVVSRLSGGCQAVVRWLSGSRQAVVRQLPGSRQAVFRQSSGSRQAVVRQSSGRND